MNAERQTQNDPFVQFLLDNSPAYKGKRLTEVAKSTGIKEQSLYAYANRGVTRFETMLDLALAFGIDITVMQEYISSRVAKRYSEKKARKIAS